VLAELDARQEKAEIGHKELLTRLEDDRQADRKSWREEMAARLERFSAETEAIKARTKAMRGNMGTSHKEMVAKTKLERDMETLACRETTEAHLEEEGTMACQEMEARPEEEEPTSVDMRPEAEER
jgi:hypothetical protein